MKKQTNMYRNITFFTLLVAGILNGCVTSTPVAIMDHLTIDKISSDKMSIDDVYIRKADEGTNIGGTVKYRMRMIGAPSDHLVVTIIDPNGKILYSAHTRYYRHGNPTRTEDTFNFSLTIPLTTPDGSTIRLSNDES